VSFIATRPRITLLILAYSYLASGFVELAITKMRARREERQSVQS